MKRYDIVCIHTIVGHDPAPAAHFSTGGYGEITQSRDTRYQSAANFDGNYRIIAIENEDTGPPFPTWNVNDGHAVPAFTPAQIESIAHIIAWCHKTHGIPIQLCPDSRPGSRGIAVHRQGIDGNWAGYAYGGRVAYGELWSKHRGKVCPGDKRIKQVREQIIPRALQIVQGVEKKEQVKPMRMRLARTQSNPTVWLGNGIVRRALNSEQDLKDTQWWLYHFYGEPETKVEYVDNINVLGVPIAPASQEIKALSDRQVEMQGVLNAILDHLKSGIPNGTET